ncbi:MAG TPA: Dna2/Cas4 domain-containing protein [Chthoniobacteraceae bacterium]
MNDGGGSGSGRGSGRDAAEDEGLDGEREGGRLSGSGRLLSVQPVDYKAGEPREAENGVELWDTDRMQLGLQILLLRENGYRCDRGIIYYRGTKQRVPLEMSAELESWIVAQIDEARRVAKGSIPEPLDQSPKCKRCSLNVVCLPDETRLLAAEAEEAKEAPRAKTRRLMAERDDRRALYLTTQGARVGIKSEVLTVKEDDMPTKEFRLKEITHVGLFGHIQIST